MELGLCIDIDTLIDLDICMYIDIDSFNFIYI